MPSTRYRWTLQSKGLYILDGTVQHQSVLVPAFAYRCSLKVRHSYVGRLRLISGQLTAEERLQSLYGMFKYPLK
jgi:hypothetical protein